MIIIPLLGLVTFVQMLYLESLRLRTRDLPSLKFFKETLEDKIGLKTEDGAGAFSLIKHTLLSRCSASSTSPGSPTARPGMPRSSGRPWSPSVLTMIAVCFRAAAIALPPHQRPLAAAAGPAARACSR